MDRLKVSEETETLDAAELIKQLQAERQKASEAEIRSKAIISSIGEGVVIVNEYGMITQVNQAALDILGFKRDEMEGAWLPKILPTKDKKGNEIPVYERPVLRSLLTGKATKDIISYVKKDGSNLPVYSSASPFLVHGSPRGAIIVFQDFTHEVQVEKAKDEFVSLASHQLRTPLTSIKMFAEILMMDKLTDEQKSSVEKIIMSTERMLDLVSDFLSISKLELGQLEVKPKKTDIKKIITQQVEEIVPCIDKKIKIEVEFPDDFPKVKVDPALLSEILHNLLTNAVRYSKPRACKVKISAKHKQENYIISVEDNGIGVPASDQPKIFQRFYRADNAVEAQDNGTGLGLYLVKKIVEALGGKIWYKSYEHKGTTFYISLPA